MVIGSDLAVDLRQRNLTNRRLDDIFIFGAVGIFSAQKINRQTRKFFLIQIVRSEIIDKPHKRPGFFFGQVP